MSEKASFYLDGVAADNFLLFVFRVLVYFVLLTPIDLVDAFLDEIF